MAKTVYDLPDQALFLVFRRLPDFNSLVNASQTQQRWRHVVVTYDDQLFSRVASTVSPVLQVEDTDRIDEQRLCPDRGVWYNACMRVFVTDRVLNRNKLRIMQLEDDAVAPCLYTLPADFGVAERELKTDGNMQRVMNPHEVVGRSTGNVYSVYSDKKSNIRTCYNMYNGVYSYEKMTEQHNLSGSLPVFALGEFKNGDLLQMALKFANEDLHLGAKVIGVADTKYRFRRIRQGASEEVFILEPYTQVKQAQEEMVLPYVIVVIKNGAIAHKYLIKTPVPPLDVSGDPTNCIDFTMFSSLFYLTIRQERITCWSLPQNHQMSQFTVLPRTTTLINRNKHARRTYAVAHGNLLCFDAPSATLYSIRLSTGPGSMTLAGRRWHPLMRIVSRDGHKPVLKLSDVSFSGRFIQLHGTSNESSCACHTVLVDMFTGQLKLFTVGAGTSNNEKEAAKTHGIAVESAEEIRRASWIVGHTGKVAYIPGKLFDKMRESYSSKQLTAPVPVHTIM